MSEVIDCVKVIIDAGFKSGYDKGYQQGRADSEKEHNAMCETCIHKVSKGDIEQIRADAIEEFVNFCINDWRMSKACLVADKPTDIFRIGGHLSRFLEQFKDEYKEQLKENKNEQTL